MAGYDSSRLHLRYLYSIITQHHGHTFRKGHPPLVTHHHWLVTVSSDSEGVPLQPRITYQCNKCVSSQTLGNFMIVALFSSTCILCRHFYASSRILWSRFILWGSKFMVNQNLTSSWEQNLWVARKYCSWDDIYED
jgi:hypothetical protein